MYIYIMLVSFPPHPQTQTQEFPSPVKSKFCFVFVFVFSVYPKVWNKLLLLCICLFSMDKANNSLNMFNYWYEFIIKIKFVSLSLC